MGEYLVTILGAYWDAEGLDEVRRALAALSVSDTISTARR